MAESTQQQRIESLALTEYSIRCRGHGKLLRITGAVDAARVIVVHEQSYPGCRHRTVGEPLDDLRYTPPSERRRRRS